MPARSANVPPIWPAPMRAIFLRAMLKSQCVRVFGEKRVGSEKRRFAGSERALGAAENAAG